MQIASAQAAAVEKESDLTPGFFFQPFLHTLWHERIYALPYLYWIDERVVSIIRKINIVCVNDHGGIYDLPLDGRE